ncbi:MAG: hypothetical protein ACRDZ3_17935 [Acidimicrobiia bacterium]
MAVIRFEQAAGRAGRRWASAVLALSAFLLISMGGAIVAAPVTVPLLVLALHRGAIAGRMRVIAIMVGGLTLAQVAWGATYITLEEAQPWIWLLPLGVAALGMAGMARAGGAEPATS